YQRGHEAGPILAVLAVDVDRPVAPVADECKELLGLAVRGWRLFREGQPEDVLEADPVVVDVFLRTEVDQRPDALLPQRCPALVPRLPGARKLALPDHAVVRDPLGGRRLRPRALACRRGWVVRNRHREERDRADDAPICDREESRAPRDHVREDAVVGEAGQSPRTAGANPGLTLRSFRAVHRRSDLARDFWPRSPGSGRRPVDAARQGSPWLIVRALFDASSDERYFKLFRKRLRFARNSGSSSTRCDGVSAVDGPRKSTAEGRT